MSNRRRRDRSTFATHALPVAAGDRPSQGGDVRTRTEKCGPWRGASARASSGVESKVRLRGRCS